MGSKVLKVIVVILTMIAIFLGGYLTYNIVEMNSEKENTKEKVKEVEVRSYDVREALDKKIDMLEIDQELDIYRYARIYENDFISNTLLDEDEKLFKILVTIYSSLDNYTAPVTTDYDFGSMENYKDIMVQIDQEKVEELYYSIFGTQKINHRQVNGCPMFIYDYKNKKYYGSAQCGGTTGSVLSIYRYKYTQEGNNYHVYLSLGSGKISDDDGKSYCFRDYQMKEAYEDCTVDQSGSFVNENNYKNFSRYKYTFIKDNNGDYIFSKLERIDK